MPTTPPTAEQAAADKPDKAGTDEQGFPVGRIKEEADAFFGGRFTTADVIGAFYGVSDTTEVTVKAARERVGKWLKAEQATDRPENQE